ncbi:MAG TPA: acyl-CoA dehydrogenase family protein, partial [Acidimicrobiales bacterium]|nr:acyl-CoA dehydrogenase family protein [Acidimicrobiales bacterium]
MSEPFMESVDRDLVDRALALRPLLAANAARCEQDRRIPDENLAALDEAGLFTTVTPKRDGGRGTTMASQLAVAAALGQGCGSTAWVQTLIAVTTWAASLLVVEGQDEIFGPGDRGAGPPRVCGVAAPSGTAVPDGDGFRVSGRWGFASGSLHSDWFVGGIRLLDADGRRAGQDLAYMPLSELTIEDTWYVAGMRGTGSNTVVADEVFVPARRMALGGFAAGTPTAPEDQAPSDRWPLGGVLAVVLMGPMLGVADATLAAVVDKAGQRSISYTRYAHQTDSPVVLADIARASLDIDSARLHVYRTAADIDAAGAGTGLDPVVLGRIRGSCGYAGETLRRAVDSLVNVGGASSFADASVLQRNWRDLNVASRHAF